MSCAAPKGRAGRPIKIKLIYWVLSSLYAEYTEKRYRFYLRFYRCGRGIYSGHPE